MAALRPYWRTDVRILDLEERNAQLRARVAKLTASRDLWKEKAVKRKRQIEECRRYRRRKASPRRYHSLEEWRQHDLIVARIRAIPNRDIKTTS